MPVTSPVQGWFKPVSHCTDISTQTVVQHNYLNCYYIAITNVFFVDVEVVAKTCPCNYDCILTRHWYNTPVVIKTTHV